VQDLGDFTAVVLGEQAAQPASCARADGLAAAFVGRLDNLQELAARLHLNGSSRSSGGGPNEARVAIASLREFGADAPAHMRGQFSAVVSDGSRLWCWRDHLGFVPLFYRKEPDAMFVATEAKQIVAGAAIPEEPDLDMLERIYYWEVDGEAPSALRGVDRLPKTTVLETAGTRTKLHRYWDPSGLLESARLTDDEVAERFEELMSRATGRALTGTHDVVALSGGIDSPGVAAFAAKEHLRMTGQPLAALSEVYPHLPTVDESRYIKLASEALGMALHTFVPSADPLGCLEDWARYFDAPTTIWGPNDDREYYMRARKLGFRTILTGDLAEFLFSASAGLTAHLLWRGRLRAASRLLRSRRSLGAPRKAIVRELGAALLPRRVHLAHNRRNGRFYGAEVPDWLDRNRLMAVADQARFPTRREWTHAQLVNFDPSPEMTMEGQEILQAVCDVEVRRPWADIDLWEFFLSLPAETRFPDARKKPLAKDLLRGKVPDEILDRRKKTVFNDWTMSQIDYEELRRALADPWYRLPGVDYERLAGHLDRRDLNLFGFLRARDLVFAHTFLSRWS
jgi:asparagine synthase (glutamine-hydrolysing)